jgi:hypothetical protein
MLSLGTPRLIRVERHRDDRAAARTGRDDGAEPLKAHGPHSDTTTAMPDVTRAALRVIIAIDSAAGLAKLAPHNPVRDLLGWHGADRAGTSLCGCPAR